MKNRCLILIVLLIAGLLFAGSVRAEEWPPAGTEEGSAVYSPASGGDYLYHYPDESPVGWVWEMMLRPVDSYDDEAQEEAVTAKVTQIAGDQALEGAFTISYYDDGTFYKDGWFLLYHPTAVQTDGEATYRVELASAHYWTVFEFTARFYDYSQISVSLIGEKIDCVVGEKIQAGWGYADRFFSIVPAIQQSYACFISPETGESEAETDEYVMEWSAFTAKKPGDYQMKIGLGFGTNNVEYEPAFITVHAISAEEAEKAWEAAWPPEGKTAGKRTETNDHSRLNKTYFIGEGSGSKVSGLAPLYLSADGSRENEEVIQEYHVTVLSGDEQFNGFCYSGFYGGPGSDAALRLNWDQITKPGEAELRIDMVSEHYYATETARMEVKDAGSVTAELISNEVNIPVGEDVWIEDLFNLRRYVITEPEYEYSCGISTEEGEYSADTDGYTLDGRFIAKQPGDYPMVLNVWVGDGLSFQFPITIHASEDFITAEVLSDTEVPLTAKGLQKEEEERQYAREKLESYKEEDDILAETEDAVYLYQLNGNDAVIRKMSDRKETVTVPSELDGHPVRKIAAEAFSGNGRLKAVILPEGLEVIGGKAFFNCENLIRIEIPSTVKEIGSRAFTGVGTDDITLPEGLVSLAPDWMTGPETTDASGKWGYQLLPDGTAAITSYRYTQKMAFPSEVDGITVSEICCADYYDGRGEDREKVKQIIIPDSVKIIEAQAFISLRNLTSVTLPAGLERIEAETFTGCKLKSIKLPNTLTYIGESAFRSNDLTSLSLPDSIREIADSAFEGCGLTSVKLPEGLEVIGAKAFKDNHITGEVVFPSTLRKLGDNAFDSNANKGRSTFYRGAIYGVKKATFLNPQTEIGRQVFNPKYSESFDPYAEPAPKDSGDYEALSVSCYPGSTADALYRYNVKKTYLKWGDSGKQTAPAEKVLQPGCLETEEPVYELIIPEGVEEIADGTFADLGTLYQVTFPESLKRIGNNAFSGCGALTKIVFPKKGSLAFIGAGAFRNCASLESFTLTDQTAEISDEAFSGCLKLAKIDLQKAPLTRIGASAFEGCEVLTAFNFRNGLETIGENAFSGSGLKKAALPDSVTAIGAFAFKGTDITSLTLPKGITVIPEGLCMNCKSLKSIKIPDGVTEIGARAFVYTYSLSDVTIPEGVTRIGEQAFLQNTDAAQYYYLYFRGKTVSALKSIKLPASLEVIGDQAFAACDALKTVTFAKGSQLREIGEFAFVYCLSLKEITLPDSVEKLGAWVFLNCVKLQKANLGSGIREIGMEAFMYDAALSTLTVPDTLVTIGERILEEHGDKLTVICPEGSAMDAYMQQQYPDVKVKRK